MIRRINQKHGNVEKLVKEDEQEVKEVCGLLFFFPWTSQCITYVPFRCLVYYHHYLCLYYLMHPLNI